jgi:hypothetical protein
MAKCHEKFFHGSLDGQMVTLMRMSCTLIPSFVARTGTIRESHGMMKMMMGVPSGPGPGASLTDSQIGSRVNTGAGSPSWIKVIAEIGTEVNL